VLSLGFSALRETLATVTYDAALFEFYHMAARYSPFVRDAQPPCRIVVDTVDVHFARLADGAAFGAESRKSAARTRSRELAAYRAADALIVTSGPDACVLASEGDLPPRWVVPIIVHVRPRAAGTRTRNALFVGHFDHAPNRDGLHWFVSAVWPSIVASCPEATLTVIGTRAPADIMGLSTTPGVRVLGYVHDLEPHLDRAAVVVAPLRYGAGMKGKVADAMAAGIPVVTTAIGAQGLGIVSGTHGLVADTAEAFSRAVCELFADPVRADDLGLAGQRHIAALCGAAPAEDVLQDLLEQTVARPVRCPSSARSGSRACRAWYLGARDMVLTALRRHVVHAGRRVRSQ
jgi:glycosyltransferase involved in cell wall biosynthesis